MGNRTDGWLVILRSFVRTLLDGQILRRLTEPALLGLAFVSLSAAFLRGWIKRFRLSGVQGFRMNFGWFVGPFRANQQLPMDCVHYSMFVRGRSHFRIVLSYASCEQMSPNTKGPFKGSLYQGGQQAYLLYCQICLPTHRICPLPTFLATSVLGSLACLASGNTIQLFVSKLSFTQAIPSP